MVTLIVLFFPAVLSVWIYEALCKVSLSRKQWLYRFALDTLLINWLCFAVKKWILGTAAAVISSFAADMTPAVACNYLIMAIPLAVAIGVLQVITKKVVRVEASSEGTDEN